jgi:predicted nucleic acid-binding protein
MCVFSQIPREAGAGGSGTEERPYSLTRGDETNRGVEAEKLATRYGLAGPDSLQLAAALRHNGAEFYTSERPGKSLFRVKELKIISLFSLLT